MCYHFWSSSVDLCGISECRHPTWTLLICLSQPSPNLLGLMSLSLLGLWETGGSFRESALGWQEHRGTLWLVTWASHCDHSSCFCIVVGTGEAREFPEFPKIDQRALCFPDSADHGHFFQIRCRRAGQRPFSEMPPVFKLCASLLTISPLLLFFNYRNFI